MYTKDYRERCSSEKRGEKCNYIFFQSNFEATKLCSTILRSWDHDVVKMHTKKKVTLRFEEVISEIFALIAAK